MKQIVETQLIMWNVLFIESPFYFRCPFLKGLSVFFMHFYFSVSYEKIILNLKSLDEILKTWNNILK